MSSSASSTSWTAVEFKPVDSGDVRLHVVTRAREPTEGEPIVVLIHGWSGTHEYFTPAMDAAPDDFPPRARVRSSRTRAER